MQVMTMEELLEVMEVGRVSDSSLLVFEGDMFDDDLWVGLAKWNIFG